MKKFYLYGAMVFAGLGLPFYFSAQAATPAPRSRDQIVMDPYPRIEQEKMVVELWKREDEYKQYRDILGSVPTHMTGIADLNGDGNPEIIVRHSDDLYGFCAKNPYLCRTHIYSVQNNQLIEIGRFMTGPDIVISEDVVKGYHTILTQNAATKMVAYVWNGLIYEPQ